MSYIFKKGIKLIGGKKEFLYSLGRDELPFFMCGLSLNSSTFSDINEFIDVVINSNANILHSIK